MEILMKVLGNKDTFMEKENFYRKIGTIMGLGVKENFMDMGNIYGMMVKAIKEIM